MVARGSSPSVPRVERQIRARLLVDADHYEDLIGRAVTNASVSVWITTANLKTMLVEAPIGTRARARGRYVSFFETLGDLARRGVDVRLLHASAPSGPLAREMARLAASARGAAVVKMRRCPRVHLKMIAIDGRLLYLGSANLTGAGLGAKGEGRRNFEMGITTDNDAMLDAAQERFDRIWRGSECAGCKLRRECDVPIADLVLREKARRAGARATATRRARSSSPTRAPTAPSAAASPGSSRRGRRSPS